MIVIKEDLIYTKPLLHRWGQLGLHGNTCLLGKSPENSDWLRDLRR